MEGPPVKSKATPALKRRADLTLAQATNFDDVLADVIANLKLNSVELEHLRLVVTKRAAINGQAVKLAHIFFNAGAAASLIESIQDRVRADVWKRMGKAQKAAARARKARR